MPTRTRYRAWTRPSGGDPARITDSVGVPLDEIDSEVEAIDTRLTAAESSIVAVSRATGVFSAAVDEVPLARNLAYSAIPKVFDASSWYTEATGRYTPQIAGYYQLQAFGHMIFAVGSTLTVSILKNGTLLQYQHSYAQNGLPNATLPVIVSANGTTDHFQAAISYSGPTTGVLYQAGFSGFLIGRS